MADIVISSAFDEHMTNSLAERYSVANSVTRRPTWMPSISAAIGDKAEVAQRRASVVNNENPVRRPSIAPAVDEYLRRKSVGGSV